MFGGVYWLFSDQVRHETRYVLGNSPTILTHPDARRPVADHPAADHGMLSDRGEQRGECLNDPRLVGIVSCGFLDDLAVLDDRHVLALA